MQRLFPQSVFRPADESSTSSRSSSSYSSSSVWSFTQAPLRSLFPPRPLVSPSLPSNLHQYTLILDLDETLLHTEWIKGEPERFIVHERPFVREFLRSLKKLPFDVVIFTAGIQGYADTVIDIMDRETNCIAHRLYRQHTTSWGLQRWKDLSLLDRDLDRTLIIDNSPDVFQHHPDNGVEISSWEGHKSLSLGRFKQFQNVDDFALINLLFWLEYLAKHRFVIPHFTRVYRESLAYALGYSPKVKAANHYVPPFELGPMSIEILRRCLPDSPALLAVRYKPLNQLSSDDESTDDTTVSTESSIVGGAGVSNTTSGTITQPATDEDVRVNVATLRATRDTTGKQSSRNSLGSNRGRQPASRDVLLAHSRKSSEPIDYYQAPASGRRAASQQHHRHKSGHQHTSTTLNVSSMFDSRRAEGLSLWR